MLDMLLQSSGSFLRSPWPAPRERSAAAGAAVSPRTGRCVGRTARRGVQPLLGRTIRRGVLPLLALASAACATTPTADARAPIAFEIENQTWETRSIYLVTETGARMLLGKVGGQSTRRLYAPPQYLDTQLELFAVVERRGAVVLASRGTRLAAPYDEPRTYATVPFVHGGSALRRWRIEQGHPLANVR